MVERIMMKTEMIEKKKKKIEMFDVVNNCLVIFITLIIIYPLYFCVIASFSEPDQVALGNTLLWIKDFTLDAYSYVLEEKTLWVGYRNSIIYLVFGTLYNLLLTIPAAYVMSKKYIPFHGALSWYFFFTMYFSGGMIPTYLLIKNLGLIDKPLVMIIGSAGVSVYNLIVTRQFFANSIPQELYEAAHVDGASELTCFAKIALPLSKPIIAVMTLYYGLTHWNSYTNALLYLRDEAYFPLQLVLRKVLLSSELALQFVDGLETQQVIYLMRKVEIAQGMKYAIIFIASAPMLIAYPFVQKHFTKGVMVGAVKG